MVCWGLLPWYLANPLDGELEQFLSCQSPNLLWLAEAEMEIYQRISGGSQVLQRTKEYQTEARDKTQATLTNCPGKAAGLRQPDTECCSHHDTGL